VGIIHRQCNISSITGAMIDEIIDDYLLSFNSIFESSMYDHSNKADSLVVMRLLSLMGGSLVITSRNLRGIAEHYLKDTIGLSGEEVNFLKAKLSGETWINRCSTGAHLHKTIDKLYPRQV
jgi:hypothetical protein